jgi:F-type H+-transporting ATPase subunit b
MQAYEKALADAAAEAQAIQRSTAQEIASATVERRTALAAKLADDTRAAESRIAAAMEPALASIQDIAAEVVRDAGARLADLEVSKADAAAAVTAAVKEAEA